MNPLRNLTRWLRPQKRSAETSSVRTDGRKWFDLSELLGDPLCIAAAYRCVKLLSESVAMLKLNYMVRRSGNYFSATEGYAYDKRMRYLLQVQPNLHMGAFEFWRRVVFDYLLHGNAYILPQFKGDSIDSLRYCRPQAASYNPATDEYTLADGEFGCTGVYPAQSVIHIKGVSRNPMLGEAVTAYASSPLKIAKAGDLETLKQIMSGGRVKGVLTNVGAGLHGIENYEDSQLRAAAQDLNDDVNTQDISSLPGDVKFQQFSQSSADMQFLEQRKFAIREICRLFGVHPSFVFDDTSNNYKSAEMANVAFLSNTLNPILCAIENELHRKLVPESLFQARRFEFDRRGVYACDLEGKAKYYTSMLSLGAMTTNDIRALEGFAPVEGGDRAFVSANLKGIDETATATPTPAPSDI